MYKPPENSNRVKAIKSKFENNSNDFNKNIVKPPLRKSKTLQDFNIKANVNRNGNASQVKELNTAKSNNSNGKVQTTITQPNLSRQLSDPAKRNIKRTPAFRLDKNNVLTEKPSDQKNARLLQNRSRYLDGKISKFNNSVPQSNGEKKVKENLSRTALNGYGQPKSTETSKTNFSDLRNKFNNEQQANLNGKSKIIKEEKNYKQQYSNGHSTRNKCNDENGPAVNTSTETNIPNEKNNYDKEQSASVDILNKSIVENKINVTCINITHENNDSEQSISRKNETDQSDKVQEKIFKFLYSEPLPKSQRNKQDNTNYANSNQTLAEDIHHSCTLKLSETAINKTLKIDNGHVSDDESHYSARTLLRNNPAYGSLRTKKSLENLSIPSPGISLTDTLKNALRKPLPKGPAPKKPPRTFIHSPIKLDSPTEVSPLNIDKDFTKKLNSELQKNRSSTGSKKSKGDAKYMLDKLETALKNKKILLRKSLKTGNASEDDSDSEKSKLKFFNLRDLPSIPPCSSSQTLPNLPYSPASSPKFNLNCLTSLGCVTSTYEAVKEPNSSFFVTRKKEEPVYAEPFEYQIEEEEEEKNEHDNNEGAIDNLEVTPNAKTIRHSLHYASCPVPNVITEDGNNHVSEVKNQDQTFASESNSACTSDMDSIVSTPSEENKTLISGIKVKDLIKAIENNSNKNSHSKIFKANSTPGAIKTPSDVRTDDDRVKRLETQLKNTLDKSFSTSSLNTSSLINANSESNISEIDLNEEDKHEMVKFETYVKRVRSKIFSRSRRKKEHLFHCCLLVALDRCTPYVKNKFPPDVQEPYKIEDLCFPEVENGPMDSSIEAQCYSLIITNEHGERTFGYCRRVLPEASTTCLPLAYCILSKHRAPGFFRRILEELEYRHGYPDKFREAFVEELYNCKFPQPGETMIIDCAKIISSAGCDKVKIGKKLPSENETCDGIYDQSTNNSDHVNMTNSYCDKKDVENSEHSALNNGRMHLNSENNEESDLDLKSYVVVCNNGEYGTLIRSNKENKSTINVARGGSAIINIGHEVQPSQLRKSTSSPNLLADIESLPSELVLMRPQDSRHEENDLKLLGETLKTPVLQQVFCSLLLERKVIFISSVLSKLSSCIEALQIILYPFSWQHTIIPVLPSSLWEIVDAPTPLVCGVLSAEVVNDYKIENAIVVNLDEGTVLLHVGDEDRILPWCLTQTLKDGLSLASKITSNKIGAHNVFFSDAFLRVFIQSCGHYKNFIVDGEFQKSEFIQHSRQKGKRIRQFLKWFTETTMFYSFLEIALHDSNSLDLFDQRITIYSSESATEILNKMKYWSNYKGFISSNLHRFQ